MNSFRRSSSQQTPRTEQPPQTAADIVLMDLESKKLIENNNCGNQSMNAQHAEKNDAGLDSVNSPQSMGWTFRTSL